MFVTAYCSDSTSPLFDPAARDLFDGLYRYYDYYKNARGLMNWHINPDGTVNDTGGATDGDHDAAMALVIMSRIFPGGTVDGNTYASEATDLINAIRDWEFVPTSHSNVAWRNLMTNGDQWGFDADRYMPDYFAPAWYRQFYIHTGDSRWIDIIDANYPLAQGYFYNNFSTGMVPNECNRAGATLGFGYTYGYNAIRYPWRIAADYLWHGSQTNSLALNAPLRLANFIRTAASNDPTNARAEYALNGSSNGGYTNMAFVSGYGAAGSVSSTTAEWAGKCIAWMRDHDTEQSYFGRSLGVLSLLLLTGEMTTKVSAPGADVTVPSVSITSPTASSVTVPAQVQVKTGNSGANYVNTLDVAFNSNVAATSDLFLWVATSSPTAAVSTVTDTRSNTWSKVKNVNGSAQSSNVSLDLWHCASPSAGSTTVTVTLTAALFATISAVAYEFSGLASSPFDVEVSAVETDFVQSHGSGNTSSTTQPTELVLAGYAYTNAGETLTASGYTVQNTSNSTQFSGISTGYKTVSASGAQSATFASSGFLKGVVYLATFKAQQTSSVYDTVALIATASDNVGVVGVQFKVDGVAQGSELTSFPYQTTWDTTAVANGSHAITAVARDAAGNSTTSASVSVNVQNTTTFPSPSGTSKFFFI